MNGMGIFLALWVSFSGLTAWFQWRQQPQQVWLKLGGLNLAFLAASLFIFSIFSTIAGFAEQAYNSIFLMIFALCISLVLGLASLGILGNFYGSYSAAAILQVKKSSHLMSITSFSSLTVVSLAAYFWLDNHSGLRFALLALVLTGLFIFSYVQRYQIKN
ncbi:hypothetical protein [Enterococcus sp. LJL90]